MDQRDQLASCLLYEILLKTSTTCSILAGLLTLALAPTPATMNATATTPSPTSPTDTETFSGTSPYNSAFDDISLYTAFQPNPAYSDSIQSIPSGSVLLVEPKKAEEAKSF